MELARCPCCHPPPAVPAVHIDPGPARMSARAFSTAQHSLRGTSKPHPASSCPGQRIQPGPSQPPAARACSVRRCAPAAPAAQAGRHSACAERMDTRHDSGAVVCAATQQQWCVVRSLHHLQHIIVTTLNNCLLHGPSPAGGRATPPSQPHLFGCFLFRRLFVVHLLCRLLPPLRGPPPPRHVAADAAHAALRQVGRRVGGVHVSGCSSACKGHAQQRSAGAWAA